MVSHLKVVSQLLKAPEVLNPKVKSSLPADIWSFGSVIYEIFTYKKPFKGQDIEAINGLQRRELPGDLSQIKHNSIRTLVSECWSIDPQKRPTISNIRNRLDHLRSEDEQDASNVSVICDYVRNRVNRSETLYKFGSSKKLKHLDDSRRISMMIENLEEDVKNVLTKQQRREIRKSIDSGQFIQYYESITSVAHPQMNENSSNCIYLWRHKVLFFPTNV